VSILLIVEVMDWAPPTLTHREHAVLLVLAEDCRNSTRETWRSVASPDVLRRARLSRTQMYVVLAALIGKGALERSVASAPGRRAKYQIPPLAPLATGPVNRDVDVSPEPGHVAPSLVPVSGTNASREPGPRPFNPSETPTPPELPPDPHKVLTQRAGRGTAEANGEDTHTREGTEQKRQRLADELNEWMRTNPARPSVGDRALAEAEALKAQLRENQP
jgi:hypothetical protein